MAPARASRFGVWGTGAAAGRQAALLFGLAAVLDVVGLVTDGSHVRAHALSAVLNAAVAGVLWLLPWQRWQRRATLLIAVPAFGLLAWSTWDFGGYDSGSGPFYVLAFVWLGLHHGPRAVLLLSPVAALSYAGPLLLAGAPADPGSSGADVAGAVVVLLAVCVVVGLIVADRVRMLQAARDDVRRAEAWRSALVSTLSHDVRSPLTSVQGVLELLADGDLPDDVRADLLHRALRQTARIRRLATGLLDLDRVAHGRLRLDLDDVEVDAAARWAAELCGSPDVQVEVPPGLQVRADPERLEQVLVNLLTNALRHGHPPVVVSAAASPGSVRIMVRDHGDGVPEADRPALFRRFSTADRSPDSVGLGLWIVDTLARAQGGSVSYVADGPGACFVVTLPSPAPAGGGSPGLERDPQDPVVALPRVRPAVGVARHDPNGAVRRGGDGAQPAVVGEGGPGLAGLPTVHRDEEQALPGEGRHQDGVPGPRDARG